MGKLIHNELLKLKYSGSVKIVWGYFLFAVILTGFMPVEEELPDIMGVGYGVSFVLIPFNGAMIFGVLAAMTAGMITQEFSQGTIHNALSCGVSRRQYFAAKATGLFGMALVMYPVSLVAAVALRSVVFGFNPQSLTYSDYLKVNLVYHFSMMALILIYVSIYILLAYIFKRPAYAFMAGIAELMLELILIKDNTSLGGPLQAMRVMFNSLAEGHDILQIGIMRLFLPGIAMGILSLVLAYLIFMKKDVD